MSKQSSESRRADSVQRGVALTRFAVPAIAALAGGVLGGLIVLGLAGDADRSDPTGAPPEIRRSSADLERLEADLAGERLARTQLAEEVARLRAEIFQLTLLAGLETERISSQAESADAASSESNRVSDAAEGDGGDAPTDSEAERPWFDDASLAALGLDQSEIEWLRERWGQHQLERMGARDLAVREGRIMSPEFRKSMLALEAGLLAELGTDRYDLMLYATNQPNRLIVRDVIDRSPAGVAGFQSGDVILDYDGQRIFGHSGLTLRIAAGHPGERVQVEIMRDGRVIRLQVPRGPLGIRLRPTTVAPSGG